MQKTSIRANNASRYIKLFSEINCTPESRVQSVLIYTIMPIVITVDFLVLVQVPAAQSTTVSDYAAYYASIALCIAMGINVYVSILIMTWLPDS